MEGVVWTRPQELCSQPFLFVDGVSRGDVKQGILGDCWLLAACAAVATRQDILQRVISPNQPLYGPNYRGMITLKFWQFGETIEVCIDDRLPTREGKLIYASCTHPQEFWLPILEKGFAKIYGGYSALEGGHAASALADLTGGIAERILVEECAYENLEMILKHGAFVTCTGNEKCETGLVQDHAYTVTGVNKVSEISGNIVELIRLRNPWADSGEWRGRWSDGSHNWNKIETEEKVRLSQRNLDDGEFWMCFQDFRKHFDEVTVATLGPDFDSDGCSDSPRQSVVLKSVWSGSTAGGSRNNLESFQENPQFLLTVPYSEQLIANSFLIGLMQKPPTERELSPIAFFIYKTESLTEKLRAEYFLCVPEETSSGPFANSHEVIVRVSLTCGSYIIIPATFQPRCEQEFMLRVFALQPFTMKELGNEAESSTVSHIQKKE